MNKTWTPEREEILRLKHAGGVASIQVALEMGLTKSQVLGKARRMGLHFEYDRKPWTEERQIHLGFVASEGKTINEAAKIFDISRTAIIRQADKQGIKFVREVVKPPQPTVISVGKRSGPKYDPLNHPSFSSFTSTQKTFIVLQKSDCHWPIADPMWCGAPVEAPGKSYCSDHATISISRGRQK